MLKCNIVRLAVPYRRTKKRRQHPLLRQRSLSQVGNSYVRVNHCALIVLITNAHTAERPPEKKAPVERAKVVFVYNADNEDELTVNTGDVVEIINKDIGQDGWWMVQLFVM